MAVEFDETPYIVFFCLFFMPAKRHATPTTASRSWLPVIVIALGVALTLWMRQFTHNGILFGADSGLKALVTQQLAQQLELGSFPLDISLNLPALDWVSALWRTGLFPFTSPAVFEVGGQGGPQTFINAPFAFPIVSAPFYQLLGARGLYVVPLVSLWIIWLRFWQVGNRARWGTTSLCFGLIALVLAAPLTLYGWVHGEYTLAVAIAFWGLSNLMFPKRGYLSRSNLLWSGFLIGLSVWFRLELVSLVIAVSLLTICSWKFPKWRLTPGLSASKVIILIGGMVCSVGLWLAINYGIYGRPFAGYGLQWRTAFGGADYLSLLRSLQTYLPLVWVVGLAAFFSPELRKSTVKVSPLKSSRLADRKGKFFDRLGFRKTADNILSPGRFALGVSLLFVLVVPLVTGLFELSDAVWGPSSCLILVPLLAVVLAEQLRPYFFRAWGRRLLMIGAAIALLWGLHTNVAYGAFSFYNDGANTSLKANYEQTLPVVIALRENPLAQIAIADEVVAQRLWNALPEKTFFRVETPEQARALATALAEQGKGAFLYICALSEACPLADAQTDFQMSELVLADGHVLTATFVNDYGSYPVYQIDIEDPVTAPTQPATNSQNNVQQTNRQTSGQTNGQTSGQTSGQTNPSSAGGSTNPD